MTGSADRHTNTRLINCSTWTSKVDGSNSKCLKYFGKRPHRSLVVPHGGECIRPPHALGRHIRHRRQAIEKLKSVLLVNGYISPWNKGRRVREISVNFCKYLREFYAKFDIFSKPAVKWHTLDTYMHIPHIHTSLNRAIVGRRGANLRRANIRLIPTDCSVCRGQWTCHSCAWEDRSPRLLAVYTRS